MAYDRYDPREGRGERSRWSGERDRNYGSREDRGFFERAGDEIASWFGDDHGERRRRDDEMRGEHERGDWKDEFRTSNRGGFSDRDYNRGWRGELGGSRGGGRDERNREHGFGDYDRAQSPYGRDETRRTSFAGSRERDFDPHYRSWRDRHLSDLDRDYDDYRRENQSRFENDFGSWRERRIQKRGMLGEIREHMDVAGNDGEHVGTVDRVAGDRIILTRSDPESGGVHHSLSCSDIDRVEGDKVILDCPADEAHRRWRDESRSRALFEREDQGEIGPRNLNRSFEGTYR